MNARDRTSPRRALLLVGHGSHLNPNSSAPIYAAADRIRASGRFDEVVEAFWKEEPSLPDALDLIESQEIFVVPVFLAEGYFTRRVVPRELGISTAGRTDGRVVHYCRPLGAHSGMRDLILRRARAAVPEELRSATTPALVVIGHGTDRAPDSGGTVYRLVDEIRSTGEFATVQCGFLDEAPAIGDVLRSLPDQDIVLVPYFIAEGWHTSDTIPADLELSGSVTVSRGRRIWYTPPVGTLPEIAELAVEIAMDEGGRTHRHPSDPLSAIVPPIPAARADFVHWIDSAQAWRRFLELSIRPDGHGAYLITHVEDLEAPPDDLRLLQGREEIRSVARLDARGGYRALRTTADLQSGWRIESEGGEQLFDHVSQIYPSAVLHWHRGRVGSASGSTFTEWASRQTGMYTPLRDLSSEAVGRVVQECCSVCLRTRLWSHGAAMSGDNIPDSPRPAGTVADAPEPTGAVVPCLEPCTIFGTRAREAR